MDARFCQGPDFLCRCLLRPADALLEAGTRWRGVTATGCRGGPGGRQGGPGGGEAHCSSHSDFESDGGGEKNFFKEN